jgi:hypothetical protein
VEPFNAEVRLMLARERAAQLRESMLAARKRSTSLTPRREVSTLRPLFRRRVALRPLR